MKAFIINYLLLILFGVALVYSSTYKALIGAGKPPWLSLVELLILIFILFITFIIVISNRRFFYKFINYNIDFAYYILIFCLILVRTPLGSVAGGAHSSLSFAGFRFQPIEIFKIVTILYMAKMLSKDDYLKLSDKEFFKKKLLLPFISIFLIAIEPDLGGTVIFTALILILLFLNNRKTKFVLKITGIISLLGIAGFTVLGLLGYDRVGAWINPFNYMDGAGQNIVQSYIAISNGGLLGLGYLNSIQNTGFLFASSTDFVFSIIAEEFGIVGVLTIIILLFTFSYQIYLVGVRSKKKYEYLVCSGMAFLILIQTAVNIGGVTGVIPMTGVTLPFISRGVNSYLAINLGVLYIILIKLNNKDEKRGKLQYINDLEEDEIRISNATKEKKVKPLSSKKAKKEKSSNLKKVKKTKPSDSTKDNKKVKKVKSSSSAKGNNKVKKVKPSDSTKGNNKVKKVKSSSSTKGKNVRVSKKTNKNNTKGNGSKRK